MRVFLWKDRMKTTKQGDVGGQATGETGVPETEAPKGQVKKLKDVLASDEHAGKGGSYVFNPDTGLRELSQETVADRAAAAEAQEKQAKEKLAAMAAAEAEGE